MLNWRVSVIDETVGEGKVYLFSGSRTRSDVLNDAQRRAGKAVTDKNVCFLIEHWDGEVKERHPEDWDGNCRCSSDEDNPCVCN